MTAETNVVPQPCETVPAAGPEPGSGFFGMLEHAEQGIADSWHEARAGVSETLAMVRASIGTAGHAVDEAVHDGTAAVGRGLDVPAHVRRHPLLMAAGALALGFAAGVAVNRLRRRARPAVTSDDLRAAADAL